MSRFEVIELENPIKGRKLFYIKFINGDKSHVINVSEGTYKKVQELTDSENVKEEVTDVKSDGGIGVENIQTGGGNVLDNKGSVRGRGNR